MTLPRSLAAVLFLGISAGIVWADDDSNKAKLKLSDTEQTILALTNKARATENLPPLKPNPILCEVARAHSTNMAAKGEMNHVLDGKNPAQRVKEAGYVYATMGENVAAGLNTPVPAIFQAGWTRSTIATTSSVPSMKRSASAAAGPRTGRFITRRYLASRRGDRRRRACAVFGTGHGVRRGSPDPATCSARAS